MCYIWFRHSSHTALNMQNKARSVSSNTHRTLFFSFIIWNHIINLLALHDSYVLYSENTTWCAFLSSETFSYVLTYVTFIRLTISVSNIFFLRITWESLSQRSPTKISPLYCAAEQMNFHSRNLYFANKWKSKTFGLLCFGWLFFNVRNLNTTYTYLQWTCFDIKMISRARLIKKNEIFITYTFR